MEEQEGEKEIFDPYRPTLVLQVNQQLALNLENMGLFIYIYIYFFF